MYLKDLKSITVHQFLHFIDSEEGKKKAWNLI